MALCLCNGKYLFVDPATINNQSASVKFSFVNSHQQATRITDFIPVLNWLNNSVLGDGPLGYEIERYFFTKKIEPASYSFFSGGPTINKHYPHPYNIQINTVYYEFRK